MASHRRSRRLSPAASDRRRQSLWQPIRPRRLGFETLEARRVLDAAVPAAVDLLPDSDSGLFDDDNLTNIRTATIEITAAEAADAIRVYRDDVLLGDAAHHDQLLYRYTFAVGQLVEGSNPITARSFDGVAESTDSPPLLITLDTRGPRIVAATPSEPFDLRAAALDSITVTFNEPIDAASFTVDDVAIQGPAGAIPAADITAHGGDQFQIHFAPQTQRGTYRITVGPEVADLAGNLMDQDNNGTPGEATDAYQYAIAAYDADAVFTTATTITEGNTTYENQHLLINGTTVTINGPHNFGSVHLINGAVLTHSANTTTQTYKLELAVTEEVIVDATSRIDVSGKGYLAGRTTGNTTTGGAKDYGGGTYGGLGGVYSGYGGSTNLVYGDYADPDDWGSGGGLQAGGGLVRITAGEFVLDGSVLADGAGGNGGGSGGGIYVSAGTLRGNGLIRAQGGSGSYAAGGGGRIAVYVQDYSEFNLDAITAPGGTGNGAGGAGTVHLVQGNAPTRVRWHAPAGQFGGWVTDVNDVRLHFNNPIDLDAYSSEDLSARGPLGAIEVFGFTLVGDRVYRIDIPSQSREGYYHFTVHPTLMGVEGFPIDQNANGIPGEPEDYYSFTLILDTTPPRISRHEPAGDVAGTLASVDVWFSEAMDKSTFTTADVAITRPDGSALAASSVQEVGFNRFRIGFAPQTATGLYSIEIGPNITDLAGNLMDQDGDGIFGEPIDDVYVASVNLVPVDLGLNNLVVHADTLWAGEPVTVSWSGFNRSGAPLLGNWTDGVYLSSDDQWDIRDVLLATVPHTGGLVENETYQQSVQVVIPGKLPDNYHILVRADVQFQQQELDKTDNLIASAPIPLDVRPLTPDGTPVQGTLTRTDRADYYAIQVAPGDSLRLTLDGHATTGSNELYVSYEAIPTRQQFNHRANLVGQDQRIVLTGEPEGGTYYVLVYGSEIGTQSPYELSAQVSSLFVFDITPDHHANRQGATVTVSGAGFDEETTVEFLLSNRTSFSPSSIQFVSSSTLRMTLDLPGWPIGLYDVRASKESGSDTLVDAFEVNQGFAAHLQTNLIVPGAVGFAIPIRQTIWVEYKNTGDVAMPAPLLNLTGSNGARLTLDSTIPPQRGFGQIPGTSDSVQFLGLGNSDTPWFLLPGETARIPVYYLGLSQPGNYPRVAFSVGTLTADDVREIDWNEQEGFIRLTDIADRIWEPLFERIKRIVGQTWGSYTSALSDAWRSIEPSDRHPITVHDTWYRIVTQPGLTRSLITFTSSEENLSTQSVIPNVSISRFDQTVAILEGDFG